MNEIWKYNQWRPVEYKQKTTNRNTRLCITVKLFIACESLFQEMNAVVRFFFPLRFAPTRMVFKSYFQHILCERSEESEIEKLTFYFDTMQWTLAMKSVCSMNDLSGAASECVEA